MLSTSRHARDEETQSSARTCLHSLSLTLVGEQCSHLGRRRVPKPFHRNGQDKEDTVELWAAHLDRSIAKPQGTLVLPTQGGLKRLPAPTTSGAPSDFV